MSFVDLEMVTNEVGLLMFWNGWLVRSCARTILIARRTRDSLMIKLVAGLVGRDMYPLEMEGIVVVLVVVLVVHAFM